MQNYMKGTDFGMLVLCFVISTVLRTEFIMVNVLNTIDSYLYYPVLIIVLIAGGLYFSGRIKFAQIRLFGESVRVVMEKPEGDNQVSSFQALMVSTASRVGTGNIIGVSTAVVLGGPGAIFWMWLLAIIGGASAFVESTLAQIYKHGDKKNGCYGGPGYYIESALHKKGLATLFVLFLIATYAFGFNLLCSYNLQSTFAVYDFYNEKTTPLIIGIVISILVGICIMGGGKKIVKVTGVLVPFMGAAYVLISLIVIIAHIKALPSVFVMIFSDAFDFKSIFSGVAGSCMVYGIKRGLYSNEAGVGSAPNAAASAMVSHPVKQGLVQMLSVYIDTLLICTATALMCVFSGVPRTADSAGAPYVQAAISTVFGKYGPTFITIAMLMFAFTALLGNLYYVDNALAFLNHKKMPGKKFMTCWRIICCLVVVVGAVIPMDAAWALADITMGGMALINIPVCIAIGGVVYKALDDYMKQKKAGLNPVFHARDIGMDPSELNFWGDE